MTSSTKKSRKKIQQYIVIPDIHVPYHDLKIVRIVDQMIQSLNERGTLSGVIQLGDALDCWQISTFDKDPFRENNLADDIEVYQSIVRKWLALMPKGSTFHQLEGNHEFRLQRYVARQASEIARLVPTMQELMGFGEGKANGVDLKWHAYQSWNSCIIGQTLFTHGFYFGKHVAAHNLATYAPYNIVCGHTHRFQSIREKGQFSMSLGHVAVTEQVMHNPTPSSWEQVLGVFTIYSDGFNDLQPIFIRDGKAYINGEVLDGGQ